MTLEPLQPLLHKLDLYLEIVDFVRFRCDIGYLVSQDLDVGRIITTGIQGLGSGRPRAQLVAHIFHDADDLDHFVLHATDRLTNAGNVLVMALDHVVVERNLLLKASENMVELDLGRRADGLAMLVLWGAH